LKIDDKNVIHSKSKQLHFNVEYNERDLKRTWSQMNLVSINVASNVVSNDCGLK